MADSAWLTLCVVGRHLIPISAALLEKLKAQAALPVAEQRVGKAFLR